MIDPVKLDDWMLGTIQTLAAERDATRKEASVLMQMSAQAQVKMNENLKVYAKEKGVSLDTHQFDDKTGTLIPKPESQ